MSTFASQVETAAREAFARSGRRSALNLLAHRMRGPLVTWALRTRIDPAEAQDLVHEAFIRASCEPKLFDPDFRVVAWLYQVVRNLSLNTIRDRKRRFDLAAIHAYLLSPPTTNIDKTTEARVVREHLLQCCDELSFEHRQILQLRYDLDLRYDEIAQQLDLEIGTVTSRLHRARQKLAELVNKDILAG